MNSSLTCQKPDIYLAFMSCYRQSPPGCLHICCYGLPGSFLPPLDCPWHRSVSVSVKCLLFCCSDWLHTIETVLVVSCFLGHSMVDSVHGFTGSVCPVQLTSLYPSRPPSLKGAVRDLSAGMWFDVVNWAVASLRKQLPAELAVLTSPSFLLFSLETWVFLFRPLRK